MGPWYIPGPILPVLASHRTENESQLQRPTLVKSQKEPATYSPVTARACPVLCPALCIFSIASTARDMHHNTKNTPVETINPHQIGERGLSHCDPQVVTATLRRRAPITMTAHGGKRIAILFIIIVNASPFPLLPSPRSGARAAMGRGERGLRKFRLRGRAGPCRF